MPGITPDFANEYTITQARNPAALTATAQSSGIDCRDAGPDVFVILNIGAVTGTSPTLDVKLQSSINDNTANAEAAADAYADITGAAFSQLTDSDANSIQTLQIHNRNERYVRLYYTVAGTNPSFLVGATVMTKKVSW